MDILILQVFVSLLLVVSSILLFAFTCRQRSFEHSDRLALLPVEDGSTTIVKKEHRGTES